ncbi:MAG: hypothetical protein LLG04_03925 [Parachlamydia sp.]|nr:hypothetical protein [Parachlamydia sp.]
MTSLWYRPRVVVRYLDRSLKTQILLIALLTLAYFILAGIFILSLDKITLAPLLSLKGLLLIFYSLLTLGIGSITAIYASTLALWTGARFLDGQGSLPETRAAVIWTFVWSIPIGIFLLLIYLTIRQPDQGPVALLIRTCSYLGVLATFIFQAFVLLTSLAEVQRLGVLRAIASVIFGIAFLSTIVWAFIWILKFGI